MSDDMVILLSILVLIFIFLVHQFSKRSSAAIRVEIEQPKSYEVQKRGRRPDEKHHFYFHVAGAKYNNRQPAVKSCVRGEPLRLVREPNNPYSETGTATLVCRMNGQELGHVPHHTSIELAPMIDAGQKMRAEVDWINPPSGKYQFGCKVRIGLLKDKEEKPRKKREEAGQ